MHHEIKWHALKYHRYVTSILENRFVNWPGWHYIEMEWNAFGDQTKVGFFSFEINQIEQKISIKKKKIVNVSMSPISTFTARAVLPSDCSSNVCLCN